MLKAELERLRQRKQEFLMESDINRQIVRVEVAQLQLKATEWRRGILNVRNAYSWMAPLAGVGCVLWGHAAQDVGVNPQGGIKATGLTQPTADTEQAMRPPRILSVALAEILFSDRSLRP